MEKLCTQKPLAFSLIWIGLYVVGMSVLDNLSVAVGQEHLLVAILAPAVCLGLYLFLRKHKQLTRFGLCKPKKPAKAFWYYIPLLVLTTGNLWTGVAMKNSPVWVFLFVIKMLCVGFLEELIFRGFLFGAMRQDNLKAAVIVSSLTFGLGHIVNLLNGSQMALGENLVQIVCAVAVGFLYVSIFIRSGSIWPCIVSHGLFNSASAFAKTEQPLLHSILLCLLALVYAGVLLRQKKTDG